MVNSRLAVFCVWIATCSLQAIPVAGVAQPSWAELASKLFARTASDYVFKLGNYAMTYIGQSAGEVITEKFNNLSSRNPQHEALHNTTNRAISESPCNFISIGNPGVGKSTILNSMTKNITFPSGVSIGSGLTFKLQVVQVGLHTYMDTPGLSDIDMRKQAAEAIKEALQRDGLYRVFFVVTLESGRVRPDDVTTMRLVLQAAPEITEYGIVVNKVGKTLHARLGEPDAMNRLLSKVFADSAVRRTNRVHVNPEDDVLKDECNVLVSLPSELEKFLYNIPAVTITRQNVSDINYNDFESMQQEYQKKLSLMETELQEAKERAQQAMLQTSKYKEETDKKAAAMQKQLEEAEAARLETKSALEQQQKHARDIEIKLQNVELANEATINALKRQQAERDIEIQRLMTESQQTEAKISLLKTQQSEEVRRIFDCMQLPADKVDDCKTLARKGFRQHDRVQVLTDLSWTTTGEKAVYKNYRGIISGPGSDKNDKIHVDVRWDTILSGDRPYMNTPVESIKKVD